MKQLTVRMCSRPYDGIMPIVTGDVGIPGVKFDVHLDYNVPRVFRSLYTGDVDLSEMSLAELIYYTSREQAEFIGIPIFSSRVFRHSFFFTNSAALTGPGDLNGRKIGFQRWVQTAGVWMRGMLVEHYGVSATETQWYVAATHHWDDLTEEEEVIPNDGSVIRRFTSPRVTGADDAYYGLVDGEVDVIGVTEAQSPAVLAQPNVRRLFADYQAEERRYFEKTRIFPIMHVLAMRKSFVEASPELPAQLFDVFHRSKRSAQHTMHAVPSWSLAWKDDYLERELATFQGDIWPFGLQANQHVLDTFIRYCHQQGIAARMVEARELFHPSTLELSEPA